MTPRLIEAYWKTVSDCLVTFFEIPEAEAIHKTATLRTRLAQDQQPRDPYKNLIYHALPIHTASDLVGQEPISNEDFYRRYRQIEDRNLKRKPRANLDAPQQIRPSAPSGTTVRRKRVA